MKWNSQQEAALKSVDEWFYQRSKAQKVFRIFGYAGTGKTTLAKHFASNIDGDVAFGAFTGKASFVMRVNGCEGASTIHSMIYMAEVDKTGEVHFRLNKGADIKHCKLIIIDECSMVNETIGKDLKSFGVPIIVLGDPAQLPPPDGAGYFTNAKPDIMLTEVQRQARDNPIVHLATEVRQGLIPDLGDYGLCRIVDKISTTDLLEADQILAGRNVTRHGINRRIRKMKRYDPDNPVVGDRLICLRNDNELGIFNGGIFNVEQIIQPKFATKFIHMRLASEDIAGEHTLVKVHKSFFDDSIQKPDFKGLKDSQEFDFGYCVTTHRAQGSQWNNVLIYDESYCFREARQQWLYTAITRAVERLTIVKS